MDLENICITNSIFPFCPPPPRYPLLRHYYRIRVCVLSNELHRKYCMHAFLIHNKAGHNRRLFDKKLRFLQSTLSDNVCRWGERNVVELSLSDFRYYGLVIVEFRLLYFGCWPSVGLRFLSFGTIGVDCRFFIVSHCRRSLLLAAVCLVSDVDYQCSLSNTILLVSSQLFMYKMCF